MEINPQVIAMDNRDKPKLDGKRWSPSTIQFINDCYAVILKNWKPESEKKHDEAFAPRRHTDNGTEPHA